VVEDPIPRRSLEELAQYQAQALLSFPVELLTNSLRSPDRSPVLPVGDHASSVPEQLARQFYFLTLTLCG
jgi:hypothetical protein